MQIVWQIQSLEPQTFSGHLNNAYATCFLQSSNANPDLRVFLKWMINRSGSVITDVMCASQIEAYA